MGAEKWLSQKWWIISFGDVPPSSTICFSGGVVDVVAMWIPLVDILAEAWGKRTLETLKIRPAFKTLALVFFVFILPLAFCSHWMYRNSETFRATNLSLRWLWDVERMLHLECTNTTCTTKEHNYWRFWFQSMVWYLIYLQWHVFNNPRLAASPLGSKVGGTDWKMEGSGTWSTCGS